MDIGYLYLGMDVKSCGFTYDLQDDKSLVCIADPGVNVLVARCHIAFQVCKLNAL